MSNGLKLKIDFDFFITDFASQDVNWWTGVVWIIVMFFISSHSDGTHSLLRIHFSEQVM